MRTQLIQSPRDVSRTRIDCSCFLATGETVTDVAVTVLPPSAAIAGGYVAPQYDQRIVKLGTQLWDVDGVNVTFPLTDDTGGVSLAVLDDQYVTLVYDGAALEPGVDFTVSGSQLTMAFAPAADKVIWGSVQNPVLPADTPRDVLATPPYSAFDATAAIVAPDDDAIDLTALGGSAPEVYGVLVLFTTSLGRVREVAVDYSIREP